MCFPKIYIEGSLCKYLPYLLYQGGFHLCASDVLQFWSLTLFWIFLFWQVKLHSNKWWKWCFGNVLPSRQTSASPVCLECETTVCSSCARSCFFRWLVYFQLMHRFRIVQTFLMRAGNPVKFFKTCFTRFLKLHPMKKTMFLMILLELELWSYISGGCSEQYVSSHVQMMRQIALFWSIWMYFIEGKAFRNASFFKHYLKTKVLWIDKWYWETWIWIEFAALDPCYASSRWAEFMDDEDK